MNTYRLLIALALVATCIPACRAQDAPGKPDAPARVAADYRLAPDDTVSIIVLNHADISLPQVTIPPDGKIMMQLIDPINVVGMTVTELTKLLTEKYRKYLINPSITVTLARKRMETVTLTGFAGSATLDYRAGMRISEMLAQKSAGAIAAADLAKVSVTHRDGTRQSLDFSNLAAVSGTPVDIELQPGDIVFVPERKVRYSVLGEVNRPGSYDYRDDMTILDAITAVGGVKETADLAAATITHDGKDEALDLDAMLRHNDLSKNRKITSGDSIMVPEMRDRTYVFGAVSKPGYYNFKQGDKVFDALNFSTPMQNADLAKVKHIRIDKKTNTAAVKDVNFSKFLKEGVLTENVALAAGDVLFIPEKRRAFQLQDVFQWLTPVGVLDNTVRVFTRGLGSNRY